VVGAWSSMHFRSLLPCVLLLRSLAPRLAAFAVLLAASSALAQGGENLGDVVMLNDGSFLRGTLVEYAAGDYAVLLTLGGQLRRFDGPQIRYAGPATGMPASPNTAGAPAAAAGSTGPTTSESSAAPPAADGSQAGPQRPSSASQPAPVTATLHLTAAIPLELFERTGISTSLRGVPTSESFTPLCSTPCQVQLPIGHHVLGVGPPGRAPLRAGVLELRGPTRVEVVYDSRRGIRVGGVVLGVLGYTGGLALMLTDVDSDDGLGTRFWTGVTLAGLGTLAWLIMVHVPDRARLEL
jgi:hypothetical protein